MYLPLNDPNRPTTTTAALATLNAPSSTLCFHARHIPSISIEAYLLRILKYCPTTNDVFLSLLVYFDRLSRVGALGHFPGEPPLGSYEASSGASTEQGSMSPISTPWSNNYSDSRPRAETPQGHGFPGISGFAIDSYNVHRLVIAGVTVASKFLSDVFYTNARYAKVGGLAVHELNQLELHFLLLTDFRLTIPLSELQQYGDQLLAYAQERTISANRT
ncbi:cyclin-like protein interacting with PHO85 [Malassezia caprae]|uniref:Cyclin-like protein interacting with PHO85 n=1 Tax=Malassezia caprae TaxID=1381934 RepID=A0AAF0IX76_9BASI|nr:cyclin-like protein interacting with PHO85 [Malassezia caprae]